MKRVAYSKQGRDNAQASTDFAKFHNPKVLREILGSRPDIDWANCNISQLLGKRFEHPEFSGSMISLFHRAFGLPRKPNTKSIPVKDVRMLLWFAMEDEMIEGDERRLERSEIAKRAGKIRRMLPDQFIEEKEKDADTEKCIPMYDKKRIAARAFRIKKRYDEASSEQEMKESVWEEDATLLLAALDLSACSEKAGISIGFEEAIWELKRIIRSQAEE